MRYNNREYPHPVLGIDEAVGGHFFVRLSVRAGTQEVRLEPVYDLQNASLQDLIDSGVAEFAAHIYCSGTMFRQVHKSSKPIAEPILIPASTLRDKVEVDFFICASQAIPAYNNTSAHSDYAGYTFPIEKGVILAVGGQGVFYANKTPEELKAISSFMNVDRQPDKDDGPMFCDYSDSDKITVMLAGNDYQRYKVVKRDNEVVDILHSSIVLPALMDAVSIVIDPRGSEYSGHKWFGILKELIDKTKETEPLRIAQKILEHPLNRTFSALVSLDDEPSENVTI